jgi:uncharacterized YigZ family protein
VSQHAFTYRTIQAVSEGFYKEKGSKFLAFAIPCNTEEEAKEHIAAFRKEHHQAVHVCSAFRFGSNKKHYRSSDDGEPSNSAGPPILGQIQSFDLTNVLIAVVRYYGGTNLGVGGLINAYRTAAKEALENAIIIEQEETINYSLHFEYNVMPLVMALVKNYPVQVLRQDFQLDCTLELSVPVSASAFLERVLEIQTITISKNDTTRH